jgi:integrase
MRLSEQYSLNWEQIDLARREIDLERTKNGSARTLPMNGDVVQAFQDLKNTDLAKVLLSPVFRSSNPRSWFTTPLTEVKVVWDRWHNNRHVFFPPGNVDIVKHIAWKMAGAHLDCA